MKQLRAETFFSTAERERIRQAIAAAEAVTSGEIVPIVVDRSDAYREAHLAGSFLLTAIAALIVVLTIGHDSVWYYLPAAALIFPVVFSLGRRLPFLCLPFLTRDRMALAVKERAIRAFYEQGLFRTAHATGVLIFISLFERRVWILGDRGINERIDQQEWTAMIDELVTGIRQENAAEAVCSVIGRCGALLRRHFPLCHDDQNELRDEVIAL